LTIIHAKPAGFPLRNFTFWKPRWNVRLQNLTLVLPNPCFALFSALPFC